MSKRPASSKGVVSSRSLAPSASEKSGADQDAIKKFLLKRLDQRELTTEQWIIVSDGYDLNRLTHGNGALRNAIRDGDSEYLECLINNGVSVGTDGGQNFLNKAIESGNPKCVEVLLRAAAPSIDCDAAFKVAISNVRRKRGVDEESRESIVTKMLPIISNEAFENFKQSFPSLIEESGLRKIERTRAALNAALKLAGVSDEEKNKARFALYSYHHCGNNGKATLEYLLSNGLMNKQDFIDSRNGKVKASAEDVSEEKASTKASPGARSDLGSSAELSEEGRKMRPLVASGVGMATDVAPVSGGASPVVTSSPAIGIPATAIQGDEARIVKEADEILRKAIKDAEEAVTKAIAKDRATKRKISEEVDKTKGRWAKRDFKRWLGKTLPGKLEWGMLSDADLVGKLETGDVAIKAINKDVLKTQAGSKFTTLLRVAAKEKVYEYSVAEQSDDKDSELPVQSLADVAQSKLERYGANSASLQPSDKQSGDSAKVAPEPPPAQAAGTPHSRVEPRKMNVKPHGNISGSKIAPEPPPAQAAGAPHLGSERVDVVVAPSPSPQVTDGRRLSGPALCKKNDDGATQGV